ncbi:hypothetical protein PPTG_22747 [Phytophthora nicotianae INRA-310]|uniref:Uncharacterized protein n=1 Tax=Phytophthora nicotianae (strain INRA-310) TaxID=761204 RepID=W2QB97_PHYN3|nr:hypothetical protein PPTG_22747 [Phytophthora nicotianae INRA-310]ETN10458.1 hypothetical protein PPTG_22747 [Phytophthora nicotianae INRA-310]
MVILEEVKVLLQPLVIEVGHREYEMVIYHIVVACNVPKRRRFLRLTIIKWGIFAKKLEISVSGCSRRILIFEDVSFQLMPKIVALGILITE